MKMENGGSLNAPRQFCEECENKRVGAYGSWKNIRNFVEAKRVELLRRNVRDGGVGRHLGDSGGGFGRQEYGGLGVKISPHRKAWCIRELRFFKA